jgi:hypothetical protein
MATKHSEKRSCYLVSSLETDLAPLLRVLRHKNIRVSTAENLAPGVSIAGEVRREIRDADFVIGVLSRSISDANVFYEIGVAYGLEKRILLFATRADEKLPLDLERHYVVRSPLANVEAVEFAINQLLNAPTPLPKRSTSRPKPRSKPLGRKATDFLKRFDDLPSSGSARALEDLVRDLLNACDLDVVSEATEKELRADFAVWSDELEPFVGNPLIIEVKSGLRSRSDIEKAGQQVRLYLEQIGGLWGLILYQAGSESRHEDWKAMPPHVFAIGVDNLIADLRGHSFPDVIRRRRNLLVHGIEG